MVVGPPGTRVSCKGLEVQVLSAAPYAVVAHDGKSAVKRLPVAGTGSRSTERQAKPKSGQDPAAEMRREAGHPGCYAQATRVGSSPINRTTVGKWPANWKVAKIAPGTGHISGCSAIG